MNDYGTPQHPLERLDDLIIDGMKLWQRTDEFRFSQDAVLLAHFVKISHKKKYAELGSGTGAIPLLLSAYGAKKIVGFEKNPVVAALSMRNVVLNHKEECITIYKEDYLNLSHTWNGYFDTVVANPPYYRQGTGAISEDSHRALALHEGETTLCKVVATAGKLLRQGGSCCLIYQAPQWCYAMHALESNAFTIKRIRFVHSYIHGPARMVLIEATLRGNPGMVVEAPLIIYDALTNNYTEEIRTWYGRER